MLAFTGRFGADTLRQTLRSSEQDEDAGEDPRVAAHCQRRRRLLHAKAEARARYNENLRLAKKRDAHGDGLRGAREAGSSEGAPSLTSRQRNLLQRWDSGELLREINKTVADWGHGHKQAGGRGASSMTG